MLFISFMVQIRLDGSSDQPANFRLGHTRFANFQKNNAINAMSAVASSKKHAHSRAWNKALAIANTPTKPTNTNAPHNAANAPASKPLIRRHFYTVIRQPVKLSADSTSRQRFLANPADDPSSMLSISSVVQTLLDGTVSSTPG